MLQRKSHFCQKKNNGYTLTCPNRMKYSSWKGNINSDSIVFIYVYSVTIQSFWCNITSYSPIFTAMADEVDSLLNLEVIVFTPLPQRIKSDLGPVSMNEQLPLCLPFSLLPVYLLILICYHNDKLHSFVKSFIVESFLSFYVAFSYCFLFFLSPFYISTPSPV